MTSGIQVAWGKETPFPGPQFIFLCNGEKVSSLLIVRWTKEISLSGGITSREKWSLGLGFCKEVGWFWKAETDRLLPEAGKLSKEEARPTATLPARPGPPPPSSLQQPRSSKNMRISREMLAWSRRWRRGRKETVSGRAHGKLRLERSRLKAAPRSSSPGVRGALRWDSAF